MLEPVRFLIWMLPIALVGCGGNDAAAADVGDAAPPDHSSAAIAIHPLATVTVERLDAYIAVMRSAASDPDQDDGEIAMERGWDIGDWMMLDSAVNTVVRAGGYEQMLAHLRGEIATTGEQLTELEAKLAAATADQRPMLEQSIETLRQAITGWKRTTADTQAMRAGGELIESRLMDIEAAKGE